MNIKQLFKNLTDAQRNEIYARIIMDGVALSTAYAYCNGQRRPKQLYREKIRQYLEEIAGIEVTVEELFPDALYKKAARPVRTVRRTRR